MPFNVLWQVKAQEEEELYRSYALGGTGGDDSGSQILFEKELRKLSDSRMRRVMGRRETQGIQNSDVEQARLRVVAALEKARQREKVLQEAGARELPGKAASSSPTPDHRSRRLRT